MSIRTTAPSTDNKYFIQTAGGGYNKCIAGNPNNPYKRRPSTYFVMPNCVGYAYGRYLEYWGLTKANLPTCDAKNWYSQGKANGFKCSKTPTVGAVAVFSGGTYGHVAFVEQVKSNGDILISESNWSHAYFANKTITKSSGYMYCNGYYLVGFVANPNASAAPSQTTTTTTTSNSTSTSIGGNDMTRGYFKQGDKNEGVYALKQMLLALKKKGIVTANFDDNNVFGAGTEAAVKQVQKAAKIAQDGCAGSQTLKACYTLLSK